MPALSFTEEWLNKLLRGDKQQTTRPQTTRIWIGDPIVNIYNQQRRRIADKPLRRLTDVGMAKLHKGYPFLNTKVYSHHAHFLGKVEITEVYDIHPSEMSGEELETWSIEDGFNHFSTVEFDCADEWFIQHHGNDWMQQTWTVIRWKEWLERYFEPEEI